MRTKLAKPSLGLAQGLAVSDVPSRVHTNVKSVGAWKICFSVLFPLDPWSMQKGALAVPCVFVCVIYTSLNSPLCNWGTLLCRVVVRKWTWHTASSTLSVIPKAKTVFGWPRLPMHGTFTSFPYWATFQHSIQPRISECLLCALF